MCRLSQGGGLDIILILSRFYTAFCSLIILFGDERTNCSARKMFVTELVLCDFPLLLESYDVLVVLLLRLFGVCFTSLVISNAVVDFKMYDGSVT